MRAWQLIRQPAEAKPKKDKGSAWRLSADEFGPESLSTVWLFLELAEPEAESSAQESEALVVSYLPSCRGFGRMDVLWKGFGVGCTRTLSGSA